MDSSSITFTENLLPKSPSDPPREAVSKQSPSSSTNPLSESAEDTSATSLKLPQESSQPNDLKEFLLFDEKQKKWIWLHICWLLWCIYACLSTLPSKFWHILLKDFDFEYFEDFMDKMRAPLCMTVPYWIQYVGIYLQDRLIMDIGIKLVGLYAFTVGILMTAAGSLYLFSPEIHAEFYNAPVKQSEKALLGILRRTGEMFIYLLITYIGAKKYVNYLIQREELLKKNQ